MQTTEVTQFQWVSVMGSNPSRFQETENCLGEFTTINNIPMCRNNPVEQVSWDHAQAFISKLNANADGFRYRLPIEAEGAQVVVVSSDSPRSGVAINFPFDLIEKKSKGYLRPTKLFVVWVASWHLDVHDSG